jgi:hypothetical protein
MINSSFKTYYISHLHRLNNYCNPWSVHSSDLSPFEHASDTVITRLSSFLSPLNSINDRQLQIEEALDEIPQGVIDHLLKACPTE